MNFVRLCSHFNKYRRRLIFPQTSKSIRNIRSYTFYHPNGTYKIHNANSFQRNTMFNIKNRNSCDWEDYI